MYLEFLKPSSFKYLCFCTCFHQPHSAFWCHPSCGVLQITLQILVPFLSSSESRPDLSLDVWLVPSIHSSVCLSFLNIANLTMGDTDFYPSLFQTLAQVPNKALFYPKTFPFCNFRIEPVEGYRERESSSEC